MIRDFTPVNDNKPDVEAPDFEARLKVWLNDPTIAGCLVLAYVLAAGLTAAALALAGGPK